MEDETLQSILTEWFSGADSAKNHIQSEKERKMEDGYNSVVSFSHLQNIVYLLFKVLFQPMTLGDSVTDTSDLDIYKKLEENITSILETTMENTYKLFDSLDRGPCNSIEPKKIPRSSVLGRILDGQKLGQCDSVFDIYHKVCCIHSNSTNPKCPNSECLQVDDLWLDEIDSRISKCGLTPMELVKLENYLFCTTANDCSVLITFSALLESEKLPKNSEFIVADFDGRRYKFKVGITDLDPKPINCIPRHFMKNLLVERCIIDWVNN